MDEWEEIEINGTPVQIAYLKGGLMVVNERTRTIIAGYPDEALADHDMYRDIEGVIPYGDCSTKSAPMPGND